MALYKGKWLNREYAHSKKHLGFSFPSFFLRSMSYKSEHRGKHGLSLVRDVSWVSASTRHPFSMALKCRRYFAMPSLSTQSFC